MTQILQQNIQRMFHVFVQLPFTTSEKELDYNHHKVSVRVAFSAVEQLNTWFLGKLGNFKKMLRTKGKCKAGYSKL